MTKLTKTSLQTLGQLCRTESPEALAAEVRRLRLSTLMLKSRLEPRERSYFLHEHACRTGNLPVLQWMVKDSKLPLDLTARAGICAIYAVESRNLELLQWLFRVAPAYGHNFRLTHNRGQVFRIAMIRGEYLPLLKELFAMATSEELQKLRFDELCKWANGEDTNENFRLLLDNAYRFNGQRDFVAADQVILDYLKVTASKARLYFYLLHGYKQLSLIPNLTDKMPNILETLGKFPPDSQKADALQQASLFLKHRDLLMHGSVSLDELKATYSAPTSAKIAKRL